MGPQRVATQSRWRDGGYAARGEFRRYEPQLRRSQCGRHRTRGVPISPAKHRGVQHHHGEVGHDRSEYHAAHRIRLQRPSAVHRDHLYRWHGGRLAVSGRHRGVFHNTYAGTIHTVCQSGHDALGESHQAHVALLLRAGHGPVGGPLGYARNRTVCGRRIRQRLATASGQASHRDTEWHLQLLNRCAARPTGFPRYHLRAQFGKLPPRRGWRRRCRTGQSGDDV